MTPELVGLVILGALLSVVALFYYLKLGRSIYIDKPADDSPLSVGFPTRMVIAICAVLVVLLGVWPGPWVETAMAAARALVGA